jgi:hypothetical protein
MDKVVSMDQFENKTDKEFDEQLKNDLDALFP